MQQSLLSLLPEMFPCFYFYAFSICSWYTANSIIWHPHHLCVHGSLLIKINSIPPIFDLSTSIILIVFFSTKISNLFIYIFNEVISKNLWWVLRIFSNWLGGSECQFLPFLMCQIVCEFTPIPVVAAIGLIVTFSRIEYVTQRGMLRSLWKVIWGEL